MASSSSSIPPKQPRPYEVFLSFRGEDTRNNFVSHLYSALNDRGIRTYFDGTNLQMGETIAIELVKAIEESSIAIVVLSSNYGSSTWCLNELVKIIECKNKSGLIVFPIFYDVDPSDVRKQENSFFEAFPIHKVNFKDDSEMVILMMTLPTNTTIALKCMTCFKRWVIGTFEDIEEMLSDITISSEAEQICMDNDDINLKLGWEGAFRNTNKLSFLQLRGHIFQGNYDVNNISLSFCQLNKLRWFSWWYYPGQSLPKIFHPMNLVHLDMSFSCIEETPDFSQMPNLEVLNLCRSRNLVHVHPFLGGNHEDLCRKHANQM